jgi:hypothetical protein
MKLFITLLENVNKSQTSAGNLSLMMGLWITRCMHSNVQKPSGFPIMYGKLCILDETPSQKQSYAN